MKARLATLLRHLCPKPWLGERVGSAPAPDGEPAASERR